MFSRNRLLWIALVFSPVLAHQAMGQGVSILEVTPHLEDLSTGPRLRLDASIESPARNDNVTELPVKKAGDTIQFQLFAAEAAGRQINGYTVELSLGGKTFASYIDDVSGADLTGGALVVRESDTGAPTLAMLSLSAVTIPASGYLGRIDLRASGALTSSDVLSLRSATLAGAGGVENLDVSQAALTFAEAAQCPGDFNADGMVNLVDFLAFAGAFGTRSGDANYNAEIDMDGSGGIDLVDFLAFAAVFGTTCEAPPPGAGTVSIPDANLRAVIEDSLGKASGAPITRADMARLTRLEAPNLDIRDLTGLEHAVNLRHLDLGRANVEGTWVNSNAVSDLRPLSSLTGMTFLDLTANNVTDASALFSLSNLELLSLSINQLTGSIPSGLGNLSKLRWLYLNTNRLTGTVPAQLGGLSNLVLLFLHTNQLTGAIPPELGLLSNLERLSLSRNRLSGAIPIELGRLSNLERLYLYSNQLSGSIPSELGNLSNLEWLYLYSNQLTGAIPAELGNLSNLQRLFLNANSGLSGALPGSFTALDSLAYLYVDGTGLCAPADAAFQRWLAGIENKRGVVNCGNGGGGPGVGNRDALVALYNATDGANWKNNTNWLSDRPLGEWYGVTTASGRVVDLALYSNNLRGIIPSELGNLTSLTRLHLYNNQLSGTIPAELGKLTNLTVKLDLGINQLSGPIPAELRQLTRLRNLRLSNNRLTGPIPAWLANLTNLTQLDVSNNRLSGNVPPELGGLSNLRGLVLYGNSGLLGPLPGSLTSLGSLTRLDLLRTQLCAPADAAFQRWLAGIENKRGVVNCVEGIVDYDGDDDGLIEVANLAQLNAIRWDLNGDGTANDSAVAYAAAYPDAIAGMGCPSDGCIGYELTNDLDYDTNKSGAPDAGDAYWNQGQGWAPIGDQNNGFSATFDGGGHTIDNLYIDRELTHGGLFGLTNRGSNVRRVGLERSMVAVAGTGASGSAAGLVGSNGGAITACYATGSVSASGNYRYVGGLVGFNWGSGTITTSHAAGSVTVTGNGNDRRIGGLVGVNSSTIRASYATASVSGSGTHATHIGGLVGLNERSGTITTSYATGSVSGTGAYRSIGGLVGGSRNGTVTDSYWDTETSGSSTSAGGVGKTTSELQSPTGYTGIYADWNPDLDGDDTVDNPWDFGTSTQYPVLRWIGRLTVPPPVGPATSDRDALVALYSATNGPNWKTRTYWLSDRPIGEWHGVTTDAAGRVVDLALYSNQLRGSIPSELGNLTNLTRLHLYNNQLSGPIPAELGQLTNLTVKLDLGNNRLSGLVPSELRRLTNLTNLRLSNNRLTGPVPSWIGSLSRLKSLSLGGNAWSGTIPSQLGNLSNLESLELRNMRLSGQVPAWLANLSNLENLYLYNNRLSGSIPAWLANLTNLTQLELSNNRLSGNVPLELGGMRNLQALFLNQNSDLSGTLPASLTGLNALGYLDLTGTQTCAPTDDAFQEWLQGVANQKGVTNCLPELDDRAVLVALYNATDGENWSNRTNWLSDEPLGEWYGVTTDGNGRVIRLQLGGNRLHGTIPVELAGIASLQRLHLHNNDLTGSIPSELGNLASLRELNLSRNELSGTIPSELGNLGTLTSLNLSQNELSGTIPTELGNLASLRVLDLAVNRLSGFVPSALGNLKSLTYLNLQSNRGLWDRLPHSLTGLTDLSILSLSNTGLCAPSDDAFQAWLQTIQISNVATCQRTEGSGSPAYLAQAVQSRHTPGVPLVAGESANLVAFFTSGGIIDANGPPTRALFYQEGSEVHRVEISRRGTLNKENFPHPVAVVPGRVIQPGLEMVIESGQTGSSKKEHPIPVEVNNVPAFDLTLIPWLWTEDPDHDFVARVQGLTSEDSLFRLTRDLLPVRDFNLSVRKPVWNTADPIESNKSRILMNTRMMREIDKANGHYMGMLREGGGLAGRPGTASVSSLDAEIIAHELGHNLSLRHAPCGDPPGPDPDFPYADGAIGVWGYDYDRQNRSLTWVVPETPDLMGYCRPHPGWISDYSFKKALTYRLHSGRPASKALASSGRGLLLWGGLGEDGELILEPAFVVDDARISLPETPGEYHLIGGSDDGDTLFELAFDMGEVGCGTGGSFAFVIPVGDDWPRRLNRITLAGPEGVVELDDDEGGPSVALLLDPTTDRVRGILRDLPGTAANKRAVAGLVPEPGLEVVISRGVPDRADWER